ncbi:hypothetical protein ACQR35_12875 [Pseudarthrobacter sp. J1738]
MEIHTIFEIVRAVPPIVTSSFSVVAIAGQASLSMSAFPSR